MFKRDVILATAALLFAGTSAHAETPCKTLDNILQSLSLVKTIEHTAAPLDYLRSIEDLKAVMDKISLPVLIPPQSRSAFTKENEVLFRYLLNVNEGLTGAQAGYDDWAKETLTASIPPELPRSLNSLDAHWNCSPAAATPPSLEGHDTRSAFFGGGALSNVKQEKIKLPNASYTAAKPARHFSGGGTVLNKVTLDTVIPEASLKLFFLMTLIMLFIAGGIYWQKRAFRTKVREQRRLLNMPVQIKLGEKIHSMDMVDISMNGFKIQHPTLISELGELQIHLGGDWHLGRIQWYNKLFAGVKFKTPIDVETFNSAK